MIQLPKAPVLTYIHDRRGPEWDWVHVGCPICGQTHIHGAVDGWRCAHCRRPSRGSYDVVGTEAARLGTILVNPFRDDHSFAPQLKARYPWSRLGLENCARARGQFLQSIGESDELVVRTMGLVDFDSWLDRNVINLALFAGFSKQDVTDIRDVEGIKRALHFSYVKPWHLNRVARSQIKEAAHGRG